MKISRFLGVSLLFLIFFSFVSSPVFASSPDTKCFKIRLINICIPIPTKPVIPTIPRFTPIPKPTRPSIRLPSPTSTITPTPTPRLFSDNFDDGNADGWWLGYSQHTPWVNGNWRVEGGMLVQDQPGDNFIALGENVQGSSQTIETQLKLNDPSGYGGITIWFQDDNNWVNVLLYPADKKVWITENIAGTGNSFGYPYISGENNTWYDLKVNANNVSGSLDVYINGVYLFTHKVTTLNRTGQSGVHNGNAGGYFDNFTLTWN